MKVPFVENTELRGSTFLYSGVDQCIAIHAAFAARKFFLAKFYPSSPFTCIFS